MALGKDEIKNRFGFHKAAIEGQHATAMKHSLIRAMYCEFVEKLDKMLPDGRNKDLAFDQLEDASMWTHKSIAEQSPLVDE